MKRPDPHSQEARKQLRAYILDTATPEERGAIDQYLAESEAWRSALETERAALARLDGLVDAEPSIDLAQAVSQCLRSKKTASRPLYAQLAAATAVLAILAAVVVPAFSKAREAARRDSVQNTLKQWGIIFKSYAGESKDFYPPLTKVNDAWVPDLRLLYPNYLTDPAAIVNMDLPNAKELVRQATAALEADPPDWDTATRIFAESFTYSGYAIRSEGDVNGIEIARLKDSDEYIASTSPTVRVYRLREGIERFFITDINNPGASSVSQSQLPVMFETVTDPRGRQGINVLYMDGHVEYVPYGTQFPAIESVAEALAPPE